MRYEAARVRPWRYAEQGIDLGEGGPFGREGAALRSRVAARRAVPIRERAREHHGEIWARVDDEARRRVVERDRELHPGVEVGESG